MKKLFLFVIVLALLTPVVVVAQEVADAEIDVVALLAGSEVIFLAGIGGLSVLALVSVIKRVFKAQGIAVIIISVLVSAGAVLIYLIPVGFILWKFVAYTVIVALAANGIFLFPKKRTT